jgi:hypothetical protein
MGAQAIANPFADDVSSTASPAANPAASSSPHPDAISNPFKDEDTGASTPAPDTGVSLDKLANAPETIPADTLGHTALRGVAETGRGVAQAVQSTGQLINPGKNAGEEHWYDTMPGVRIAKGIVNTAKQGVALGKEYARDGGPSKQELKEAAVDTAGQGVGQFTAGAAGGKLAAGAADLRTPTAQKIATPIKATVPEAAMQPDKAVAATDKIYKAAAPVATDMRARANFHAAAGDLAQVADKVDWDTVRGGKALTEGGAAPDMRPRAVLHAVNERMGEMYAHEVEPKMQAMEGVPAKLPANPDAYKFLATTAGDEGIRSLATKAAANPESITVPEAYQLSKAVNAELVKFESLPPDQQYLAKTTNPAINQLEGLDEKLNQTISGALKDRGVAGIDNFNRRYAAMASVRRALGRRVNAAELQREGTLAKAGKVVRAVTGRNVNSIASASQASLADVNIGDQLEKGLKDLKGSGVRPQIDAQPAAPKLSLKPSGSAPPDAQRPMSFMDGPNPNKSGPVYPGGQGNAPPAKTSGGTSVLSGEKTSPTSSSGSNGQAKTFAGVDFGADLEQAKSELAAGKITRDKLLSRAQEIKDQLKGKPATFGESGRGESRYSYEGKSSKARAFQERAKAGPEEETRKTTPEQYLRLVGADEGSIVKTPKDAATVEHFRKQIREGNDVTTPEIHVDEDKNVVGADGRHRALAYQKEGVRNFKVKVKTHAFEKSAKVTNRPGLMRALSK